MGRLSFIALALLFAGCFRRATVPEDLEPDARTGHPPDDFGTEMACRDWAGATEDLRAIEHTSFPEHVREGCFVPVRYRGSSVRADPTPEGCGYPEAQARAAIERRAAVYEVAASSWGSQKRVPLELACGLPEGIRRSAALQNARTLRGLGRTWAIDLPERRYPYSIVGTFGFGQPKQDGSVLARWKPGDDCIPMSAGQLALLDVNVARARRAADAYHAGVAPLVTVSGAAVHSSVVEAFFLVHLLTCNFDVPADRILVDPCADHTHTNLRNTGAMVASIGGRFAYLVTDDGIQSAYLQEWTAFDLVGGSIDQRALRDFGHLIGSWRQASVGMPAGFWYTPYRFWAASRDGLGSFTCQGDEER